MPQPSMSYFNELVRTVREEHGLKLMTVAEATHFSKTSINDYELGHRGVPVDYVARLFATTGDLRLVKLVWPGAQVVELNQPNPPRPTRTPPAGNPRDLLASELAALRKLTAAAELVERIVRDGVVDEADDLMLVKLAGHHTAAINLFTRVDAALANHRDQSERRKN